MPGHLNAKPEDRWVVNHDPETGWPLEIAYALNRDQRVCFLTSDGTASTARLIAAAPEMLAALKIFVAAEEDWHARDGIMFDDPLTDAYNAACAAISKAERT